MCAFAGEYTQTTIVIILSLTFVAINLYLDNKKAWLLLSIFYIVLCVFFNQFIFFLPMIFYSSIRYEEYRICIPAILAFFISTQYNVEKHISIFSVAMFSVVLGYYSKNLQETERKLIVLRDTSKERDILLKEKNKQLIERQNYEIHLATLSERNRIAREIHDNVGHMLTRSILQVGALTTIHKEEPLHEQLNGVSVTLNNAMNSIRESVHNLHDNAVDLEQAVLEITDEIKDTYNLNFEYDMSGNVPGEIKYTFIAVVKEALSNIIKHSNAEDVHIIMREHPAFFQMSIMDNGTVIENDDPGIGLLNMRERVEKLGGTINFSRKHGFKIFITIRK